MKITLNNLPATVRRLSGVWDSKVLPILSEQILSDCNTYVRKQDGNLAESVDKEDGGKRITWNTIYAKRVYYTGIPRTNKNPLASLRWCERAKREHKAEWVKQANDLLRE